MALESLDGRLPSPGRLARLADLPFISGPAQVREVLPARTLELARRLAVIFEALGDAWDRALFGESSWNHDLGMRTEVTPEMAESVRRITQTDLGASGYLDISEE